jgi:archaellum component FlaC
MEQKESPDHREKLVNKDHQGIQGETGSAGADGQNGADGMDGQDGMDVNESRIAQLEAELASKDATIAILLGNISDMEEELEAVDDVIEMYYMMFVQIQNDMNDLESNLMDEINWVNNTVDWAYMDLSGAYLSWTDLNMPT